LTIKQIENHISRVNRKDKVIGEGKTPKAQGGRPRKEIEGLGEEVKRLRMENELLRDFLHEIGRE
jgi:archaellum component FlaC